MSTSRVQMVPSDEDYRPLLPLLKWAGGKRKVLPHLRPFLPSQMVRYIEPFLGGGAMLFDLAPQKAIVNDVNAELISMYEAVRDSPSSLIDELTKFENSEDAFYEIRNWDRSDQVFSRKSKIELAARTIFLNQTCFNGLYRVNSKNQFNVPYGKYVRPNICDEVRIEGLSKYLNNADVEFSCEDYSQTVARARSGDFIYVDPPYAPFDSAASTFTNYSVGGFSVEDLLELLDSLNEASQRGASWMLSNGKSSETMKVFSKSKYQIHEFAVSHSISPTSRARGAVTEILVRPK